MLPELNINKPNFQYFKKNNINYSNNCANNINTTNHLSPYNNPNISFHHGKHFSKSPPDFSNYIYNTYKCQVVPTLDYYPLINSYPRPISRGSYLKNEYNERNELLLEIREQNIKLKYMMAYIKQQQEKDKEQALEVVKKLNKDFVYTNEKLKEHTEMLEHIKQSLKNMNRVKKFKKQYHWQKTIPAFINIFRFYKYCLELAWNKDAKERMIKVRKDNLYLDLEVLKLWIFGLQKDLLLNIIKTFNSMFLNNKNKNNEFYLNAKVLSSKNGDLIYKLECMLGDKLYLDKNDYVNDNLKEYLTNNDIDINSANIKDFTKSAELNKELNKNYSYDNYLSNPIMYNKEDELFQYFLKLFLKTLIVNATEIQELNTKVQEILYSYIRDRVYFNKHFLSSFEVNRLKFNFFGETTENTKSGRAMILSYLIIIKTFIHYGLLNDENIDNENNIANNANILNEFNITKTTKMFIKIFVSILHFITRETFRNKPVMIRNKNNLCNYYRNYQIYNSDIDNSKDKDLLDINNLKNSYKYYNNNLLNEYITDVNYTDIDEYYKDNLMVPEEIVFAYCRKYSDFVDSYKSSLYKWSVLLANNLKRKYGKRKKYVIRIDNNEQEED